MANYLRPVAGCAFLGIGQVNVIDAISGESTVVPEPGELCLFAFWFPASILLPVDVGVWYAGFQRLFCRSECRRP